MTFIARLAGEGIGPFKNFDFDFYDARGNPHPGPHVFVGVNGSGKSTILRTLAWMFALPSSSDNFPWQEWQHLIQGHKSTRAMVVVTKPWDGSLAVDPYPSFAWGQTTDTAEGWQERLRQWMISLIVSGRDCSLANERSAVFSEVSPESSVWTVNNRQPTGYLRIGGPKNLGWRQRTLATAYGPSRMLRHLPEVDLAVQLKTFKENSLSFEATVRNEVVQSWLVGLLSKEALAKIRGQSGTKYSAALGRFQTALEHICGQDIQFTVDIEPSLHPKLRMYNKWLDFSQLPDGVRSIVGWLADFLMRVEIRDGSPESDKRGSVLLLDEVDAHLHPKWQRTILPCIKKALPESQVFVTSHSPFVVSSCRGAKIHVLELGVDGTARNRPPEDAPIGESLQATIKDIFGVGSRFDLETEELLEEWNELHRSLVKGALSSKERERMEALKQELSSRSEELRQLVSPVVPISESVLASLRSQDKPQRNAKPKARK